MLWGRHGRPRKSHPRTPHPTTSPPSLPGGWGAPSSLETTTLQLQDLVPQFALQEDGLSLNREHLELWLFKAKGGKTLKTDLSFLPKSVLTRRKLFLRVPLTSAAGGGFHSTQPSRALGEQPCFCHGLGGSGCAPPGLPQPPAFLRGAASPPHTMPSFRKVPLTCPHLPESSPAPAGKQRFGRRGTPGHARLRGAPPVRNGKIKIGETLWVSPQEAASLWGGSERPPCDGSRARSWGGAEEGEVVVLAGSFFFPLTWLPSQATIS